MKKAKNGCLILTGSLFKKEIPIKRENLKQHIAKPKSLELYLYMEDPRVHSPAHMLMQAYLEGWPHPHSVREWEVRTRKDQIAAIKNYKVLAKQIKQGNYVIHVYNSGKIELKTYK